MNVQSKNSRRNDIWAVVARRFQEHSVERKKAKIAPGRPSFEILSHYYP